MKKGIIIFSCMLVMHVHAQDSHFSQFYSNKLYTNPAFTGTSEEYAHIALNGRKQFSNMHSSIYTSTLNADMRLGKTNSGLGFISMYDQAGSALYTTRSAGLIYSYRIIENKKITLISALQASFVNKSIDVNKLVFGDQLETEKGIVQPTMENIQTSQRYYPNFGTGLIAYNTYFYAGIAIHNLTEPNQSFIDVNSNDDGYRLKRKYTLHGGLNLLTHRNTRKAILLSPSLLVMHQDKSTEVNMGFYARKRGITTGIWLRQTMHNSDACIFMIGYKYNRITLGYSYDMGIGSYSMYFKSAHEISLQFAIEKNTHSRPLMRLHCPAL